MSKQLQHELVKSIGFNRLYLLAVYLLALSLLPGKLDVWPLAPTTSHTDRWGHSDLVKVTLSRSKRELIWSSGSSHCDALCAKLLQSCPTLCDPLDCSPPGSSVHGILPARILVWGFPPSHWREQERFSWVGDWLVVIHHAEVSDERQQSWWVMSAFEGSHTLYSRTES